MVTPLVTVRVTIQVTTTIVVGFPRILLEDPLAASKPERQYAVSMAMIRHSGALQPLSWYAAG